MRWKLYAIDDGHGILESPSGDRIDVTFTPLTRMPIVKRDGFDKHAGPPPEQIDELADEPVDDRTNGWSDPWPLLPQKTPDELVSDRAELKELIYDLNAETAMDECDTGIEVPYFTHGVVEPDRIIRKK